MSSMLLLITKLKGRLHYTDPRIACSKTILTRHFGYLLVSCLQFNISEVWYTRKNDVIGFANLDDVGMVTYSIDVTGGDGTRWAAATNVSSFPPQLQDVVTFNDTFARLFAVAVRVGMGT